MPGDHRFTLDKCQLTGQVINILRAQIGVSRDWNAAHNPPRCYYSIKHCGQLINFHGEIMSCNGKPNCSFSQDVFSYTSYDKRCTMKTERNFIQIYYGCINGKRNFCGLKLLPSFKDDYVMLYPNKLTHRYVVYMQRQRNFRQQSGQEGRAPNFIKKNHFK